jgi:pyruvate ferredoxin oxidoreductase alpha subunit
MGALQLSDARMDTDYQRHTAMALAYEVLERVFAKFEQYSGRRHGFIHSWNERAETVFVVAGAAYGTFEEVARELGRKGIEVGTLHPNVLRPFPKRHWAEALCGKRVFVFDRDDPYGAVGGRLYTELAGVVNEYDLAASGTRLYSRIYGLGGRTPSLAMARDEMVKALRERNGVHALSREKSYVSVNI